MGDNSAAYYTMNGSDVKTRLANGTGTVMTPKEQKSLAEFKKKLGPLLKPEYTDRYLLRWLKARSYDVNKAYEMFKASLAFRERMGCQTLIEDYQPPEVLQKYLPGGFCGYDKEGSPVLVELYGHTDMKGLLHSAKRSDIEKTKLQLGERVMRQLKRQTAALGKPVEGMTVIIDMEKVGSWMLWGPGLQMYAHMGRILQDNYPEIVKRTFIVNAPAIFPVLWKIVKPLITEEMKRKVCILGAGYQRELLKHIDADQLPAFLGGNMKDPDGDARCPSRICQGGKVPEEYYLRDLSHIENLKTVTVAHGDKLRLDFEISEPRSLLRWEFKTDGYDIGFGINFSNGTNTKEIIKMSRVNSHFTPEDGAIICKECGKYVVTFDNSYSWTRSKALYYKIDVLNPDQTVVRDLDSVTQGGSWDMVAEKTEYTYL